MHEAAGVGRGAGYTAFDGEPPAESWHFAIAGAYAHATAPLRRLQDRYVSECCLAASAGTPIPDWVHAGLAGAPRRHDGGGTARRGRSSAGWSTLSRRPCSPAARATSSPPSSSTRSFVQLAEPAVRGKPTAMPPTPGNDVSVRLELADLATRSVRFTAL